MPRDTTAPIRKFLIPSNDPTGWIREGFIVPNDATVLVREGPIVSHEGTTSIRKTSSCRTKAWSRLLRFLAGHFLLLNKLSQK